MKKFISKRYYKYKNRFFFFFHFWKNRILGKPRILLYTDSRGKNIPGHHYYEHYSAKLAKEYATETHLCPHKWTTLIDFFQLIESRDVSQYDAIVLHLGVVCQSPRHQKSLNEVIYPKKREAFNKIFGETIIQAHLKTDLGVDYENDHSNNMYSIEMAEEFLIPRLKKIPNLIWIGGNKIVPNWLGNYWKPRPTNLPIVEEYYQVFERELNWVVSLMDWTLDEVKEYTYDIIHVNEKGSDIIFERLSKKLYEFLNS